MAPAIRAPLGRIDVSAFLEARVDYHFPRQLPPRPV
jgi:hypothetical protein